MISPWPDGHEWEPDNDRKTMWRCRLCGKYELAPQQNKPAPYRGGNCKVKEEMLYEKQFKLFCGTSSS